MSKRGIAESASPKTGLTISQSVQNVYDSGRQYTLMRSLELERL